MKFLFSFITTLLSLCSTCQNTSLADSLKDIPLNEMRAYFKEIYSLNLSTNETTELQYQKIKSFIKANPKNIYSPQFISWGKYFDPLKIDTLFSLLDHSYQQGMKEVIRLQKLRSTLTQGISFPELILTDTLNHRFDISSLKGKIVFIDVWASWCHPCREEMPQLIKLYEKYKDKGFVVIAISLDDDKTKWLNAIAKDLQPWPQFCEFKIWQNSSMLNKWGINGIPYNFLIDKQGKLNDKEITIDSLEDKIRQLL